MALMNVENKLSVEKIDAAGKRVFVRVDFNVPLKDGEVENDKRLRASLPTIEYLRKTGAKVVLASHLGRPDGKRRPEMSLAPVARALGRVLGTDVKFVDDCIGTKVEGAVAALGNGDVLL